MLANIIFFMVISSFAVFSVFKFNKSFEETVTIGCTGTVLILFLFGLAGYLSTGITVILLISAFFYILICKEIIDNRRNLKNYLSDKATRMLTPGTVIFSLLYIIFNYIYIGQYAWIWDEFSHWAYTVKTMTILNDFDTNPLAYSWFPNYPPAMALFQYLLQKINLLFNGKEFFSEWRLYLAHHIFFASLFMPHFKGIRWKDTMSILSLTALVILLPVTFFNILYYTVYIDGFLAAAAGAGFVMILCTTNKDWTYHLYMWFIMSTLVLTKEAGLALAAFILILYLVDIVWNTYNNKELTLIKSAKSNRWNIFAAVLSVVMPKFLWSCYIGKSDKTAHIELNVIADIFSGTDTSYRSEVFKLFKQRLFEKAIHINFIDIKISYFAEIVLAIILISVTIFLLTEKHKKNICAKLIYSAIFIIFLLSYIFGMLAMYMFTFSEYEALQLAEFDRYINIAFYPVFISALMLVWKKSQFYKPSIKNITSAVLCGLVISVLPLCYIKDTVNREYVDRSVFHRSPYFEISEKIMSEFYLENKPKKVCLVCGDLSGYEYMAMRFSIYPNIIIGDISELQNFAEHKEIPDNFDYVAIHTINDDFADSYSSVFENPADIAENRLYKVNKETGKLTLVKSTV